MNFGFATVSDIRFGRGTSAGAIEAAAGFSNRVLVVHGKSADRAGWLVDGLATRGLAVETVACPGEPDIVAVEDAVALARRMAPGVVIALGGGAAIDLGKAVAALCPSSHPTLAYLEGVGEGRLLDAAPLPFIAMPTTAGTGAEVTKNAVISVPDAQKKVSLRDVRMLPDIAIVDPALTDGAPASVTFGSGFDAITQVIEPFLSVKASPMTDALCRDAIPRGLAAIRRLSDGDDPKARDDMALTSLLGGMALANAGLGAVHGLAGVIGGRTGAPHGEICAALLPHVLAYDLKAIPQNHPAKQRLDQVLCWIGAAFDVSPERAPIVLKEQVHGLGIRSIRGLGLKRADIMDIARSARGASSSRTNPMPLEDVDYEAIVRSAIAE
jgi:alcohol dehydrogenase class IV